MYSFIILLFSFLSCLCCEAQTGHSFSVTGKFDDTTTHGAVKLAFYDYYFSQCETIDTIVPLQENTFGFTYDKIDGPGWLRIDFRAKNNWIYPKWFLVMPGDELRFTATETTVSFYGKDSARFTCMNRLEDMSYTKAMNAVRGRISYTLFAEQEKMLDSMHRQKMLVIDSFANSLDEKTVEILRSSCLAERWQVSYNRFKLYWIPPDFDSRKPELIRFYNDYYNHQTITATGVAVMYARLYGTYLVDKAIVSLIVQPVNTNTADYQRKPSFAQLYNYLTGNYTGNIRARGLMQAFTQLKNFGSADSLSALFDKAMFFVEPLAWQKIFLSLANTRQKGMPAFDFSLRNTYGKLVKLSDLKGKVVVMDFWFTGCTGCRSLANTMKPVIDSLSAGNDIVFVSVSIDKDESTWKKSVAAGTYTSNREINLYTNGQGDEHPLIKYYRYTAYPQMLVIDRKGNLYDSEPPKPQSENLLPAFLSVVNKALRVP